jgi:hypothetical protein
MSRTEKQHERLATEIYWRETWPGETGLHVKSLQDFKAGMGKCQSGASELKMQARSWQWRGHGGRVRQRLTPHQGYVATAREASRMAEDYYERLMRHNGMKGNHDVD